MVCSLDCWQKHEAHDRIFVTQNAFGITCFGGVVVELLAKEIAKLSYSPEVLGWIAKRRLDLSKFFCTCALP